MAYLWLTSPVFAYLWLYKGLSLRRSILIMIVLNVVTEVVTTAFRYGPLFGAYVVVSAIVAYWVYSDSRTRQVSLGWLFVLLTVALWFVGLPLYLLTRNRFGRIKTEIIRTDTGSIEFHETKEKRDRSPLSMQKRILLIIGTVLSIAVLAAGYLFFRAGGMGSWWDDGKALSVSEGREVRLAPPVGQKMLAFETERIRMGFGISDFTETLERQTGTGHGQAVLFPDPVKVSESVVDMTDSQRDTRRVIAELLDAGKVSLYDKEKGKYSESIRIERYNRRCWYLLCGNGGRRYSLPGDGAVFLEIADRTP